MTFLASCEVWSGRTESWARRFNPASPHAWRYRNSGSTPRVSCDTSSQGRIPLARKISDSTVRRLSAYLRILENLDRDGETTVFSERLAQIAATTAAQVRKDLSLFGSFGKRGLGYSVSQLAVELREILGLHRRWRLLLAGAGRIGAALFEYSNLLQRGFEIVAVVDTDPAKIGTNWRDLTIQPASDLEALTRSEKIDFLVVAVPADSAQGVVDQAVRAGVQGILNFAPARLHVPDAVELKNVNIVMELEALSFALSRRKESEEG